MKPEVQEQFKCVDCGKHYWYVRVKKHKTLCETCAKERQRIAINKAKQDGPVKNRNCAYCSTRPIEGQYCSGDGEFDCRRMSEKFRARAGLDREFWK